MSLNGSGSTSTLRSEGPAVSSPVREGGVNATFGCLSAEGAPRFVSALWASGHGEDGVPALTDGATNCRSLGPESMLAIEFEPVPFLSSTHHALVAQASVPNDH